MVLEPDLDLRGRQTQTLRDRLALRRTQIPRLVEPLLQLDHLRLREQNPPLPLARVQRAVVAVLLAHVLALRVLLVVVVVVVAVSERLLQRIVMLLLLVGVVVVVLVVVLRGCHRCRMVVGSYRRVLRQVAGARR